MAAAEWDIDIEENSQFDFYVTKYDSQCSKSDITGYGAKFQVRAEQDESSTVIYEATVGSGIQVMPGGEIGLFQITQTVAEVNAPGGGDWTKGFYDFVVWPPGGSINDQAKRLVQGRVRWKPAVTHP